MNTKNKAAKKVINTGNAFEQKARLEKALKLFAALPSGFVGASAGGRVACATLLRTWDADSRNIFAIAAGCANIASNQTWEMFCQMVEGS